MDKRQRVLHRSREKGATIVEMSLAMSIAVMILAIVVDASMLLYNYGLLTDASAALSRGVSATYNRNTAEGLTCKQLACRAKVDIEQWKARRGYAEKFSFTPWVAPSMPRYAPYPTLRVEATWKNSCIFCSFVPGGLTWRTWSIRVLEYDRTACTHGEDQSC